MTGVQTCALPISWEKAKADAREFYIEEMFQAVLAQQRKAARIEVLLK